MSGVGGHTLLGGVVHFDLEEGVYIIWSRESHTFAGGLRRGVF